MEIKKEEHNIKMVARKGVFRTKKSLFHWHHNFEICQVLENDMDVCVNGVVMHAKAGDIIAIGENVIHQFQAVHETAYLRVMQFSLKVLMESGIPIENCQIHITLEDQEKVPGLRDRLNYLLDAIEEEKRTEHGENNYFQQSLVSAVYCLLTRHFPGEDHTNMTKDQKDFLRILEYISNHFEESLNVNVLAAQEFVAQQDGICPFSEADRQKLESIASDCIAAVTDGVDAAIEKKPTLFAVLTEIQTGQWYDPARVAQAIKREFPDAHVEFMPEFSNQSNKINPHGKCHADLSFHDIFSFFLLEFLSKCGRIL